METFKRGSWQLIRFAYLEAMSCVFPVIIFGSLLVLKAFPIPYIQTYDAMLLICIAAQAIMLATGLESKDELKVICVFHLIGLALELYKVHMGSWTYPQDGLTKVVGVPLYSGFMYASVASYLCQAWRRMDLQMHRYPSSMWTIPLGVAIYLNFMTHHYILDLRWMLTGMLFLLFFRTYISFRVGSSVYKMPLVLAFLLIGFFIWIAENFGTLLGAWRYPNQEAVWTLVSWGKMSSWFLLVIVSFIIVAQLKHMKNSLKADSQDSKASL